MVKERVGGSFWAAPAHIPEGTHHVLVPDSSAQLREMLAALGPSPALVVGTWRLPKRHGLNKIANMFDPWSVALSGAILWVGAEQELALIAAVSGSKLRVFGSGRFANCLSDPNETLAEVIRSWDYRSPFTGETWSASRVITQLGEWRRLIESNRAIIGVQGIARWKRETVDVMLWDGTGPVRHNSIAPAQRPYEAIAVWRSRVPMSRLSAIKSSGARVAELEDGFIRSVGLGVNCVPPLSLIVDFSGIYFDPYSQNDLETLLHNYKFDPPLIERASKLRSRLVKAAINKYGQGGASITRPLGQSRRVLVTGQVEGDRSVILGGLGTANLQLLERARELEPSAWLIYKPHPDVEAGHREGSVPLSTVLRYANEVARNTPIIPLLNSVDSVHVITSLVGFEALLRGKDVTTHGAPFYAGWGLTHDIGSVFEGRITPRSLDELVAATLLLYPRYIDPVTRLPCSAELLVDRIDSGEAQITSLLVKLRKFQGQARTILRALMGN